jgi:hypothetical protein
MIVQPDFLDHWKTQRLIALTNNEAAPLMVIRLWGYCQQRRQSSFDELSAHALATVCRWRKDPDKLMEILKESGFIRTHENRLIVHDWDEVNSSLLARWKGGETTRRKYYAKPSDSRRLKGSLAKAETASGVEMNKEQRAGSQNREGDALPRENPGDSSAVQNGQSIPTDSQRSEAHQQFVSKLKSLTEKMRAGK